MTQPPTAEPTVAELFDLTDHTALVTGASGYLGGALARALAEAGARVVAASRDVSRAREFAGGLPSPGGAEHAAVAIDYLDEHSIHDGFEQAAALAGGVDIVINNGHASVPRGGEGTTYREFAEHQAMSAGYYELSRLAWERAAARRRPASIVMIGSMYGMVGSYPDAYEGVCPASPAAYHALKGGIIHLTRRLAVYWAADSVRVNCLSPGPFPSEKAPRELCARLETKSPMRRMGAPFELKGAVVYLASRASSYVTGQNLVVDGGWTAW